MNISEMTKKMDDFVRAKGWYQADSNRPQTPRNLAISLSLASIAEIDLEQAFLNKLGTNATREWD